MDAAKMVEPIQQLPIPRAADAISKLATAPPAATVRYAGADEVAAAIELRDEPGISAHYRRGLVRTLTARACEEAATR